MWTRARVLCASGAAVQIRPRRTALYIPGVNQKAMQKAATLASDVVILDLEDSVSPDQKATARATVQEALAARPFGRREVVVRINGLDTPWWEEDLRVVTGAHPNAILLPKVSDGDCVRTVDRFLDTHPTASMFTKLWAMIETARGVIRVPEIAASTSRLECLVMGTEDLVKELRAAHTPSREPVLYALSACVLAARAHGLSVLDGVYTNLNDDVGLVAQATQALQLGFDGKTVVHPRQIGPVNDVFTPSAAAVQHAQRVVAALAEAQAAGRGIATLDGRMVEALHADAARRLVALSQAIRELTPP